MPRIGTLAAAVALLGASAMRAAAQERSSKPQATTSLQGVVRDTARSPIEGAEVLIHRANRSAHTSPAGVFRLDALAPGRYWVTVRRIGYAPLRAALTLEPNQVRQIVVELAAMAHELPEVEVRAEATWWARRFREFSRREKSRLGRFVTRDDIDRMRPIYLADLVHRYSPFNRFNGFEPARPVNHHGSWMTSGFGRGQFADCPPAVSLNGGSPMLGWAVNDFQPGSVEALEIYRRSGDIPAEFGMPNQAGCGLVVVWLRSR